MAARAAFDRLIHKITGHIGARALDGALQDDLNHVFAPDGEDFAALAAACRAGIDEGWLCARVHDGIRYGRVIQPAPETRGFSVDVVLMEEKVGPHHRHPAGEIDMIIPETPGAKFNGAGQGWLVYGPGTAHHPTVTAGRAIVLYLLPEGEIEFTAA